MEWIPLYVESFFGLVIHSMLLIAFSSRIHYNVSEIQQPIRRSKLGSGDLLISCLVMFTITVTN